MNRHHKARADHLKAKFKDLPPLASASLEDIQRNISTSDTAVRNNAGGHYNHSLFWTLIAPADQRGAPSAALRSVEDDGSLAITTTANQDNPLIDAVAEGGPPVLALDVWEHAYYLHDQNKRADYIKAWWPLVKWKQVNARHDAASSKR